MTDDHSPSGHDDHGDHEHEDHGGVRLFLMVFGALCVLTTISFAVANSPIMDSVLTGWTVMMAVSCMKAMLVMTYFMHLKWEANWKYVLTIPASIMSVFLVLMLVPDIGRRTIRYQAERWLHAAEPEDPAAAHGDDHSNEEKAH